VFTSLRTHERKTPGPADQECVILTEDVPAFVRCDGPLYVKGPVWRIEQTVAR
jgi:hypothetical protein